MVKAKLVDSQGQAGRWSRSRSRWVRMLRVADKVDLRTDFMRAMWLFLCSSASDTIHYMTSLSDRRMGFFNTSLWRDHHLASSFMPYHILVSRWSWHMAFPGMWRTSWQTSLDSTIVSCKAELADRSLPLVSALFLRYARRILSRR